MESDIVSHMSIKVIHRESHPMHCRKIKHTANVIVWVPVGRTGAQVTV